MKVTDVSNAETAAPLIDMHGRVAVQAALADRPRDSKAILDRLSERCAVPVIPPRPAGSTTLETHQCLAQERAQNRVHGRQDEAPPPRILPLPQAHCATRREAANVAADGAAVRVVVEPVADGRRHDGVAEYQSPLADGAVRGGRHSTSLEAAADEIEERVRGVGLELQARATAAPRARGERGVGGDRGSRAGARLRQ